MTSPHRPGDLVRVVIESVVRRVDDVDGALAVGEPGDGNVIHPDAAHVKSVEVLAPPEKQWVNGDVVRSAKGGVFVRVLARDLDGWWVAGSGHLVPHDHPSRPLTELVPKEAT